MQKIRFDTFFRRLCDATRITSQANLAKSLSVSRSAITQAKRNDSIPQKWIFELSRLHNLNQVWLEKGIGPKFSNQNNYQEIFLQVPKVRARLSAGGGSFETEPGIEEFYSFRSDWLSKKGKSEDMVLMDITGNSMEPELKDGDTVLIDTSRKEILAGSISLLWLLSSRTRDA